MVSLIIFSSAVKAGVPPIDVTYNDGIYHIVLKGDKIKRHVKFISSESLITAKEAHNRAKAKLTVNAGYFDPENQKSISYIVSDRNTADDPLLNENLPYSLPQKKRSSNDSIPSNSCDSITGFSSHRLFAVLE